MFRPILIVAMVASPFAFAGKDKVPQNKVAIIEECGKVLLPMGDEEFKQASQKFALLFDQVIKNGGAQAGPLITRLTYLAHHSPEIHQALEKMQNKVEFLLNTEKGTTMINVGFYVEVEDPYADQPNQELPSDSDLMMLLLNGRFSVVGPELTPDRGRDEQRLIDFGGLKVAVANYKLKDRLTPPVNDYLMAALFVVAMSDPNQPNEEFGRYGDFMMMPWNKLETVTEYLKTVAKTTITGHFPNVNTAIENVTLENTGDFKNIQLPKPGRF